MAEKRSQRAVRKTRELERVWSHPTTDRISAVLQQPNGNTVITAATARLTKAGFFAPAISRKSGHTTKPGLSATRTPRAIPAHELVTSLKQQPRTYKNHE